MEDHVGVTGSIKDTLDRIGVDLDADLFALLLDVCMTLLSETGNDEYRYADLRIERPHEQKLVVFRHDKHLAKEREIVLEAEYSGDPVETIEMIVFRSGDWIDLLLAIREAMNRGISPEDLLDLRERFNPLLKPNKTHQYEDDLLWNVIQELKSE